MKKKIRLNYKMLKVILNKNEEMAQNALRVLAVAYKDIDFLPDRIDLKIEITQHRTAAT